MGWTGERERGRRRRRKRRIEDDARIERREGWRDGGERRQEKKEGGRGEELHIVQTATVRTYVAAD